VTAIRFIGSLDPRGVTLGFGAVLMFLRGGNTEK